MRYSILILPLLLCSCLSQSKVQGRYVEDQGGCQHFAEENIEKYTAEKNLSVKDRNAELVTLFSDCMGKQGWQVAKPKRAKKAEPTAAVAPQQQPQQQAIPTQSTPLSPAPEQAPLNPPASAPPGAATYQPARSTPPSPYPYGTGPGRNF